MFNINSLHQVKEIAEGFTNYALGREKELADKRYPICLQCPLYNKESGRCDVHKCYNKEKGILRTYPGDGYICGCNCIIKAKVVSKSSTCPLDKWPE